jgi:hypothetical protein
MVGVSKSTCVDVMYKDLHRVPVMYHWVTLAVRWWNKMSAARQGVQPMACCAWVEDVKLAIHSFMGMGIGYDWFPRLITTALLLDTIGCCPDLSTPRTPKVHLWFTSSAGQGDLPTAAKWFNLVWEFS